MDRRTFLKTSAVAGGLVGAGTVGWLSVEPNHEPLTIRLALEKLDRLMHTQPEGSGTWSLSKVLVHSAQSVEFSMLGFPQAKSAFFQKTVGSLAFSAFMAKGKMKHGLAEPIPGAPEIPDDVDITLAYERFRKALLDFQQFGGKLSPHFAYGELTKAEYEVAHVLHFNNHLIEFV